MFHKTGGNMVGAASALTDKTLGDYIKRKTSSDKPKLTFEEWMDTDTYLKGHYILDEYGEVWQMLEHTWRAAQENV